jgi:hypothetical protein
MNGIQRGEQGPAVAQRHSVTTRHRCGRRIHGRRRARGKIEGREAREGRAERDRGAERELFTLEGSKRDGGACGSPYPRTGRNEELADG